MLPRGQSEAAHDLRVSAHTRRGSPCRVGLIAGGIALALYALTCARGVEWQDPGIHQYRIVTAQLEHPLGLALSHPLHYWVGRAALLLPGLDPVFKLNLMSALFGAVGVGALAGLVTGLTHNRLAGGLAAATLALAHSYWQMSALTETYSLAAALMTIEWVLLLRYARTHRPLWLVAVFAVNGLHVADHLLGLLTLATYGVLLVERIVRRRVAPRWLPVAIGAWIVTASPYLLLVVGHFARTGDLAKTLHSALFGGGADSAGWAGEVLNASLSLGQLKLAGLTFGYCFPSAAGLVALVGLLRGTRGRRRLFRLVLLAQTVVVFVFVGRYTIRDLYTYFVPVCVLTALWFGLGADWLLRLWASRPARRWITPLLVANALLPLAVYVIFPVVAQQRGWMRGRMRPIPFRNEYLHFFRPWRFLDDSPVKFARAALNEAGPDGWILADSTTTCTVATECLTGEHLPSQRVYWGRTCLTDLRRPPLTDEELRARVEQGGRVIAVPSSQISALVPEPLVIEKREPFWRISNLSKEN